MSPGALLDPEFYFSPGYFKKFIKVMGSPELKNFTWDHPGVCIEPFIMGEQLLEQIKRATEDCGHIYSKAVKFALKNRELLKLLGVPPETLALCRRHYDGSLPVTAIGRFDFALTSDGSIKLLEFNSDTPTGVVEATAFNSTVAALHNMKNPNHLFKHNVKTAFDMFTRGKKYENIVFTSLGWHDEDRCTTLAEMEFSGLGARYLPLDKLTVDSDGLYDDRGRNIDLLYRLYPPEWLALEQEGIMLMDLVARGKLDILNPPWAFVAQSKSMQALIWELGQSEAYFDSLERGIIRKHFLPTFLEPSFLAGIPHVAKPSYGREGGGVALYNARGQREHSMPCYEPAGSTVYQERVELPRITIKTWSGKFTGRLLVGSFLVGGAFSGIFLRVGHEITGNAAYCLPVALAN